MPRQTLDDFLTQEQGPLTNLDLSQNNLSQLEALDFDTFCNQLQSLQNLESLDLTQTSLYNLGNRSLTRLCEALSQLKQLHTLRLGRNSLFTLNAADADLLCKTVGNMPNLKCLDFNTTFYHRANNAFLFAPFCLALSGLQKLETLDLGSNHLLWLDTAHVEDLCKALSDLPHLKTLKLGFLGNNSQPPAPPAPPDRYETNFNLLFRTISELQQLQDLDLSYTAIWTFGLEKGHHFCNALGSLKNLQSLDLSGSLRGLDDTDMNHLRTVMEDYDRDHPPFEGETPEAYHQRERDYARYSYTSTSGFLVSVRRSALLTG